MGLQESSINLWIGRAEVPTAIKEELVLLQTDVGTLHILSLILLSLTRATFVFPVLLCAASIRRRPEAPEHSVHCALLYRVHPQDPGLWLPGERKG